MCPDFLDSGFCRNDGLTVVVEQLPGKVFEPECGAPLPGLRLALSIVTPNVPQLSGVDDAQTNLKDEALQFIRIGMMQQR